MNDSTRENLGSRLGFILLTAGCAIGLGNIWRFPFICGQYGGAIFVLIYLFFLITLGYPVMVMELALGRASRRNIVGAYTVLPASGKRNWRRIGMLFFTGNIILMIFYTSVTGWMIAYACKYLTGSIAGLPAEKVGTFFNNFFASPEQMVGYMLITVVGSSLVCALGLRRGVERITKILMGCLLLLLFGLCIRSCLLPGAGEGLRFYLEPSLKSIQNVGLFNVIVAAMGQAFFTLSLGIGSIAIFGSYVDRTHSLAKESLMIIGLDTLVALLAGVIIFPACFSYGVDVDSGPGLIFVSLPNVFNHMTGGRLWGTLFFLFMSFAALSTVIAVFENIVSICSELTHAPRKKVALVNIPVMILLCLPCILGFNLWSGFQPFGPGSTIQDLEDFIVSNTILPIGTCVYVLFCTHKSGWGYENFLREANAGEGLKLPRGIGFYLKWILPVIILVIFLQGYWDKFL